MISWTLLWMQILRTGFFHADPHPGNLAIDVDETLIYYDFGMMGDIKSFTRERLLELFYSVYEKDAKKVRFPFFRIVHLSIAMIQNHALKFIWNA